MGLGKTALSNLAAARNEPNELERRKLLEHCWAPNGCFEEARITLPANTSEPGIHREATSLDELVGLIGEDLRDPQHWVQFKSRRVEESDGQAEAHWRVKSFNGTREETVAAQLSDDGHIEHLRATNWQRRRSLFNQFLDKAAENPLLALSLFGGVLFLVLRLPLGLFYNDFGVTPEEAGFETQDLVPRSLILLVGLVASALALAAISLLLLGPYIRAVRVASQLRRKGEYGRASGLLALLAIPVYATVLLAQFVVQKSIRNADGLDRWTFTIAVASGLLLGLLLFVPRVALILATEDSNAIVKKRLKRSRELAERFNRTVIALLAIAAAALLLVLPIAALRDADNVREGGTATGRLMPWRAVPAHLEGSDSLRQRLANSCKHLRYLGEANGGVVLFDTRRDKVFRIPADKAVVVLVRECRT